ncbi:hypothetical protein CLOP_g9667 [Closterium sp. NIES-67]|nr:hypothetical protein CLOP_g9667 [Closterium sp. NIES-67]
MGISWSASVGGPRIAGGGTRLGPAAATAGMVLECQKPSLSNSGSRSGGCVQAANDTMPSLSAVPRRDEVQHEDAGFQEGTTDEEATLSVV